MDPAFQKKTNNVDIDQTLDFSCRMQSVRMYALFAFSGRKVNMPTNVFLSFTSSDIFNSIYVVEYSVNQLKY